LNGLIGAVGKQCRIHMFDNIDKALNMAIVATNAEKEEKASGRDDRGTSVRVFTLGGSRGGIPENRDEKHRGKIQWSGARGAGSQFRAGQTQNSRRVDGAYSYRTDHWTPAQPEDVLTPGGARSQNQRTMTIGTRHVDHMTFNIIIAGWWDTFLVIVLEGKREI